MALNLLRTCPAASPSSSSSKISFSVLDADTAATTKFSASAASAAVGAGGAGGATPANSNNLDVKVASSPSHLAQSSPSLIVTMLPASAHVRHVYLNEKDGILKGIKDLNDSSLPHTHTIYPSSLGIRPGTLVIDSSTIDPRTSKEVAEKLAEKGAIMVDAPVSGGTLGAQAGKETSLALDTLVLFTFPSILTTNSPRYSHFHGGC
jgi:hypothetical protein